MKLYFLSILVFSSFILNAQITFKKQFHTYPQFTYASSVLQTYDHGYLLMSTIVEMNTYRTWLIKTIETGDTLWTKMYSHGQTGWIKEGVVQCPDSGFAVLGFKNGVYLLRLDKNGDSLWGKELGRGESKSIAITPHNEFTISGMGTDTTLLFIRATYEGELIIHKDISIIPPPGYISSPEGYSIKPTYDDGVIIGGTSKPGQLNPVTYGFLVKTDYYGNMQWVNKVTYLEGSAGYSVDITTDSGFVFTGKYYNGSFLLKTTFLGDTIWVNKYTDSSCDYFCVTTCSEGDYVACGYFHEFSAFMEHILLTRTSQSGSFIWSRNLFSAPSLKGYCVKQTFDGGFIILGTIEENETSTRDLILIKTDPSGNITWIKPINQSNSFSIYPNPASEYITIEIPEQSINATIEIFDLSGKCQIQAKSVPGKKGTTVYIGSLEPGEYLVKISGGRNLYSTKKIIRM